jgi:hypothetical protein
MTMDKPVHPNQQTQGGKIIMDKPVHLNQQTQGDKITMDKPVLGKLVHRNQQADKHKVMVGLGFVHIGMAKRIDTR